MREAQALVGPVPLEILDALVELVVLPSEVLERCAEQRLGFIEAFVDTGLDRCRPEPAG